MSHHFPASLLYRVATAFTAFATLFFVAPTFAASPIVWTAPSLTLIMQNAAQGNSTQVSIKAAQGETESFQIAIKAPTGGLTNVNVTPAALSGPNGSSIAPANITLYREQYVKITKAIFGGTNKSLGPGMYPDALIPFANPTTGADLSGTLNAVPFSLTAGQNAVVWVDVSVPRTAAAGSYQGTFTVTSDQGSVQVPVALTVWNFAIPLKPALDSSFLYWKSVNALQPQQELLRNRLMPQSVNTSQERELIDNFGLKSTDAGFWSGASYDNCNMTAAPSVSAITSAVAEHQSGLEIFDYSADEIENCTNLFSQVKEWGKNFHQGGVTHLVVTEPNPALFDDGTGSGKSAVDIWVVLPYMYENSKQYVTQALAKGDRVWSYNTLEQDEYSPKWVIGYAPINWRIQPGFINESLGLSGLLYWQLDQWSSDPWNNVTVSNDSPGDGMFVYPGEQVGLSGSVIASIRLKWLRDGADDYDYIELLKKKGDGAWALSLAKTIGPDWKNWTRDTDALENARSQLGERLSGSGGTPACANLFPSNSAVPSGFGSSWNQFSTAKELLLSAACSGTNLTVTAGNTTSAPYVYKSGYLWTGSTWQPYAFSGATANGDWFVNTAQGTIPKQSGTTFFVGYTCLYIDGAWKCGCSDTACGTPKWQIQGV